MKAKTQVYARPHDRGMAIYVVEGNITKFVMLHRKNCHLYFYLKDGVSLGEMRRYRPGRNRADQQFSRSLGYVIRNVEWVLSCYDEVA